MNFDIEDAKPHYFSLKFHAYFKIMWKTRNC